MKRKILITGTGRSGTSILVQLFSHLNMETGYGLEVKYDDHPPYNTNGNIINAGLENHDLTDTSVRIHKAPGYAIEMPTILDKYDIEHVIIPVRDLTDSANSRVKAGLLWGGGNSLESQIVHNSKLLYNLIHTLVKNDVPHTFLPFPEIMYDHKILYNKLKWLFDEYNITEEAYLEIYNKLVDKDKINFKK